MVSVYVGCYSENLYYTDVDFHPGRGDGLNLFGLGEDGALTPSQLGPYALPTIPNPSFMTTTGNYLYAVHELSNGKPGFVSAWRIGADGALTAINSQRVGLGPAHLSVHPGGQHLMMVDYLNNPSVVVLPISKSDGSLGPICSTADHTGKGGHVRQADGPHPHSVYTVPWDVSRVLVLDLGLDQVVEYHFDVQTGKLSRLGTVSTDPQAPSGGGQTALGPRHLAFHPNSARRLAFVANELDSSVSVLAVGMKAGELKPLAKVDALPADFERAANWAAFGGPAKGVSHCADIHVSPCGNRVYVSNRGHDSIGIFRVSSSTATLESIGHVKTEGRIPRNFAIDPSGQFMVVCNQESDRIDSFRIDASTGLLQHTGHTRKVGSPTCCVLRAVSDVAEEAPCKRRRGGATTQLPRRRLGRTNFMVSAVSLGGCGLGSLVYGKTTEQEAIDAVQRALQRGVNFIDTSPLYGESEKRLGLALAKLTPEQRRELILCSKVGDECPPYSNNGGHHAMSREGVRCSVENSLRTLGVEHLHLVLLHDPTGEDLERFLGQGGGIEALRELRAEGKVGHFGIGCVEDEHQLSFITSAAADCSVVLTVNDYNILRRYGAEGNCIGDSAAKGPATFAEAQARDIGVMNAGAFYMGLLADPQAWQEGFRSQVGADYPKLGDLATRMKAWCESPPEGSPWAAVPLRALALQFAARHEAVATVPVGCRSAQEVDEVCDAFLMEIPEAMWAAFNARFGEELQSLSWTDHWRYNKATQKF